MEALRDEIADRIDAGVPPRDLAALSLRLLEISDELAGVVAAEEGDDITHAASIPDAAWRPNGGE